MAERTLYVAGPPTWTRAMAVWSVACLGSPRPMLGLALLGVVVHGGVAARYKKLLESID